MERPLNEHSGESSDDDYGAEISDILFGRPAWFIRIGACMIGVVFLLAIGASCFISYPTRSQASISFSDDSRLTGAASFPSSFVSGLHPGQSILVELGSSGDEAVVRVYAKIDRIVISPHERTARMELAFPSQTSALKDSLLSGRWTITVSKNDGRRLFFALFA